MFKIFELSVEDVLKEMAVDPSVGLSKEEIKKNLEKYGKNKLTEAKKTSVGKRLIQIVIQPMTLLLIGAGVLALFINIFRFFQHQEFDFTEVVGIFVAILILIVITLVTEQKSQSAIDALKRLTGHIEARVIRGGGNKSVAQSELTVGDIVILETGNRVLADGRLIETNEFSVDESSLTGETDAVNKDFSLVLDEKTPLAERKNMVYSGSFVTSGQAKMIVTSVANQTEFGKIAEELKEEQHSTPLEEKLKKLSKNIALLSMVVATLSFVFELYRSNKSGDLNFSSVTNALISSIVLMVASVPEGLPAIVACSLAVNMSKMSKSNALVKKPSSCETIGSINVICSDKTGTLTQNKMVVSRVFSLSDFEASEDDSDKSEFASPEENDNQGVELNDECFKDKEWVKKIPPEMIENFFLNRTADVEFLKDGTKFIGSATECALLVFLKKIGIDYGENFLKHEVIHVYPFSSQLKYMSTIATADSEKDERKFFIYTKGNPDKIFEFCKGEQKNFEKVREKISFFQDRGYRVIAFAHKKIEGKKFDSKDENIDFEAIRGECEVDMCCDGFVAICDPLRPNVAKKIKECLDSGIDIKILTGDNIKTVKWIANQLGVIKGKVVEASEIAELNDSDFDNLIKDVSIVARSTPEIKMRITQRLMENNNVVAVIGDGVNDAPAIKSADVGIAMGTTGTEVSKDASDIILTDDSFGTFVRAIRWGRGIYENFQRFIQFQLTVNFSSVVIILWSLLSGNPIPFTSMEMLWMNMIMDGPPALTLGLRKIDERVLKKKPISRNAAIITKRMLLSIFSVGLFISIFVILEQNFDFLRFGPVEKNSSIFTMFVLFQIFNAFNSCEIGERSSFATLKNDGLVFVSFSIVLVFQVFITQFGSKFFGTHAISAANWLKLLLSTFSVIIFSEVVRFGFLVLGVSKKKVV